MLFDVQRNGRTGSPFVWGSIKSSNRCDKPGKVACKLFRPPPLRRSRGSSAPLDDASCDPFSMVFQSMPVAACTSVLPPRPVCWASIPAHILLLLSSKYGYICNHLILSLSLVVFQFSMPQYYIICGKLFLRNLLTSPRKTTMLVQRNARISAEQNFNCTSACAIVISGLFQ